MEIGPILRAIRRNLPRFLLTVGMTGLTLAIVVNCLQMIFEQRADLLQESGFVDEELVYVQVDSFEQPALGEEAREQAVRDDLAAMRAMPGVVSVTSTFLKPWRGGGSSWQFRELGTDGEFVRAQMYPADSFIVETLGAELVGGRTLDDAWLDLDGEDVEGEHGVFGVIISQNLAEKLFGNEDPLGRLIVGKGSDEFLPRVVGVIDEFWNPYAWDIEEEVVLYPSLFVTGDGGTAYLVRVEPKLMNDLSALESLLLGRGTQRNVMIEPIVETRRDFQATSLLLVRILVLVIVLMTAVTALGIVGITSFSVTQRTRQIGTRRALGATKRAIVRYFLVENGLVTAIGIVLGTLMAYALNLTLVANFDAQRLGTPFVVGGIVLVLAVSLLSALAPALRGARVAPVLATARV